MEGIICHLTYSTYYHLIFFFLFFAVDFSEPKCEIQDTEFLLISFTVIFLGHIIGIQ